MICVSDCLLSPYWQRPDGYARHRYQGRMTAAHRVAWINARGPIPGGLHVCHKCDVRNCVNPEHLFLGTHKDNMADMARKGRHALKAGMGPSARLNWDKVREIRSMDRTGLIEEDMAAMFGVSRVTINDILNNRTWRIS